MAPNRDADARHPRVGLFGGTFDPPHVGHVRVARDVADALALDRVVWMPAGDPPHKGGEDVSAAQDRLALTRAAASLDPRFEVSTLEIARPGPSYTVDTVRALAHEDPEAELFVIIGADQYEGLDTWRDPDGILEGARLAVMDRAGTSARSLEPAAVARARPERVVFVPVHRVDVSSTEIRSALAAEGDASGLVPPEVLDVIRRRGLYGPRVGHR